MVYDTNQVIYAISNDTSLGAGEIPMAVWQELHDAYSFNDRRAVKEATGKYTIQDAQRSSVAIYRNVTFLLARSPDVKYDKDLSDILETCAKLGIDFAAALLFCRYGNDVKTADKRLASLVQADRACVDELYRAWLDYHYSQASRAVAARVLYLHDVTTLEATRAELINLIVACEQYKGE